MISLTGLTLSFVAAGGDPDANEETAIPGFLYAAQRSVNPIRLIVSPQHTAGEESGEEDNSIVQLPARAGHIELVTEPMKVQHWS